MRNVLKLFGFLGAIACLNMAYAAPTPPSAALKGFPPGVKFSRVFFFGDSLSDEGNNQSGADDQAPDTNKSKEGTTYEPGATWTVFFTQLLKDAGMLEDNASTTVEPSRVFDGSAVPSTSESIDFAYSGDPSNGYPNNVTQYHPLDAANDGCINSMTGTGANALCGVYNRVREFGTRGAVDPNALYVIWVGANDIQQQLGPSMLKNIENEKLIIDPNNPPGQDEATRTILGAISSIDKSIINLTSRGAKYFIVINLPNLGYTPEGYLLNQLYYQVRDPEGPKPATGTVITQVFSNLTTNFNSILKNGYPGAAVGLNDLAPALNVTIVQPDVSQLFAMARNYELPDFPHAGHEVNTDAVMSYMALCCYNHYADASDPTHQHDPQHTYDPETCTLTTNVALMPWAPECPGFWHHASKDYGFSPKIFGEGKDGQLEPKGHFLFFNDIHPTTCTHKYIAQFVMASVQGQAYTPPTAPICDIDNQNG